MYKRQKLEKEGIIKKYVALVNREKIGRNLIAFCNVSLKEHSRANGEKFVSAVMTFEEVMECYNISGEYDFMSVSYTHLDVYKRQGQTPMRSSGAATLPLREAVGWVSTMSSSTELAG